MKKYLNNIDSHMFGMNLLEKYDYLSRSLENAFNMDGEFTEKHELLLKAIILRLSEVENEIKNN